MSIVIILTFIAWGLWQTGILPLWTPLLATAVTMLKAVCIPIPDDDNDKGYK